MPWLLSDLPSFAHPVASIVGSFLFLRPTDPMSALGFISCHSFCLQCSSPSYPQELTPMFSFTRSHISMRCYQVDLSKICSALSPPKKLYHNNPLNIILNIYQFLTQYIFTYLLFIAYLIRQNMNSMRAVFLCVLFFAITLYLGPNLAHSRCSIKNNEYVNRQIIE